VRFTQEPGRREGITEIQQPQRGAYGEGAALGEG
jgi:hypothetical protein